MKNGINLLKPKAKPIKYWKKKADTAMSLYVRKKHGYCQLEGKDHIRCSTVLQNMHVETRGKLCIRYEEYNTLCGCSGHHVYYTNHPNEWREFVMKWFPEKWELVMEHHNDLTKPDYQVIIKHYTDLLETL